MAFKPSKTVSALKSGRMRDDEFDALVREAAANRDKVYEDTVSPERAEEIRKGLDRSVKYLNDKDKSGENLNVSLLKEFIDNEDDNGDVVSVMVRFQATERRKVNRNAPDNADGVTGPDRVDG